MPKKQGVEVTWASRKEIERHVWNTPQGLGWLEIRVVSKEEKPRAFVAERVYFPGIQIRLPSHHSSACMNVMVPQDAQSRSKARSPMDGSN
jgi:hypothetical protein